MTPPAALSACDLLEQALRCSMASGVELTDDVRHFMAVTFGDASAATLQTLLADESSAERDSLLDLVFFPDPRLQQALEPVLTEHPPTEAAVGLLAERLKAAPLVAHLRFPETDMALPAAMPVFGVDAFLARLNLAWQPVADLAAAITDLDTRPLSPTGDALQGRNRLRVCLRNAALKQTAVQVRFLCDFFARMPPEDDGFVDKLGFMLVFMNEHEDATNLYQALMDRKKFLFQHLHKARRTAALTDRSNMETLIMTGVRIPHFDIDAAERTLALIDSIAVAVFGRTEWLGGAPREVDLGNADGGLDPATIIRRLS